MIVRSNTDNWQATMQKIENEYEKIETARPFDYAFLEDRINDLYLEERRSGTLMKGLSLVALILAMMGLAGIVSYVAYSRQKEIGIRKVLGASVGDILVNFNKQFSYMTLLATIIALPTSIYLASKWLEGFAFQIEPQFWVVLLAGFAALILVVFVVTIQARWAARQHPIDVLKVD
jgi:putative ABC transport system permease protein